MDSISDPEGGNKTMKGVEAVPEDSYMNDDGVYESPDSVVECIERSRQAGSKPEIPTGQESSTYMSLKDNKEPGNVYQSLQPPNIQTVEYENPAFTSYGAK